MSIHFHEPGSFHDNRAIFDVGVLLRGRGQHRDAERIFEMLERHIEETGEPRSKELLLGHIRAELAIVRGEAAADLVGDENRTWKFPWWRFRISKSAAVAIYYAVVFGLWVSISIEGIWVTIPP